MYGTSCIHTYMTLLEDCREPEPDGGWRGFGSGEDPHARWVQRPTRLMIGRRLSSGGVAHLSRFSLSSRSYLGRTTLPPDLAYLMAIQARVRPGSLVLDPFCGTCSTLLSCAALGAATVGVEVDTRVLHGFVDGRPGIARNFAEAGLDPPERLVHADMAQLDRRLLPEARYYAFDALVTDPPYGLMEGLGDFYLPLSRRLTALLRLACARLRVGGRLVFLLPVPPTADEACVMPDTLPCARWLAVERVARQKLTLRMHRLMVTMVKVREFEEESYECKEESGTRRAAPQTEAAWPAARGGEEGVSWGEWWRTIDAIEEANVGEASRVW